MKQTFIHKQERFHKNMQGVSIHGKWWLKPSPVFADVWWLYFGMRWWYKDAVYIAEHSLPIISFYLVISKKYFFLSKRWHRSRCRLFSCCRCLHFCNAQLLCSHLMDYAEGKANLTGVACISEFGNLRQLWPSRSKFPPHLLLFPSSPKTLTNLATILTAQPFKARQGCRGDITSRINRLNKTLLR